MSYSGRYFIARATPTSNTMATTGNERNSVTEPIADVVLSPACVDAEFEWVERSDIVVDDTIELPEFKSSPPMNFFQHFQKKAKPSSSVDDKDFVVLHSALGSSDSADAHSKPMACASIKMDSQRHRTSPLSSVSPQLEQRLRTDSSGSLSLSSQLETSMELSSSMETSSPPSLCASVSPLETSSPSTDSTLCASASTLDSSVHTAVSAGRFIPKTTNQYSSCPTKVCKVDLPQEDQPIDDKTLAKIHASAISYKTRRTLCMHMNPEKICGSDWKGLADYLGYDMLHILNFDRKSDPMNEVLTHWLTKKDSTLGTLIENIRSLEREDVLMAIEKPLKKDVQNWIKRQKEMENPVQVHEVSGTCYPYMPVCPELRGITLNDSPNGPIETFDAYVCHNPDTDYQFVLDMINAMEKPPYNLRFCTDWRDLVPGGSYATVTAELIENRCKRMIVVLTPEFLDSGHCDFQAKFALSLSPGARDKRMVPIMVTSCTPPSILRHITVCDYTKEALRSYFWRRLYKALDND